MRKRKKYKSIHEELNSYENINISSEQAIETMMKDALLWRRNKEVIELKKEELAISQEQNRIEKEALVEERRLLRERTAKTKKKLREEKKRIKKRIRREAYLKTIPKTISLNVGHTERRMIISQMKIIRYECLFIHISIDMI